MTLLRQIKEELARAPDFLPYNKLMLWSAFPLAFYGFLRSSEFTSPSTTQFNPLVHLCLTDVSFTSEGCLTLHLKSSKTDPYRQGCSLLIAPSLRSVCAVRALRKYLSLRSISGASPLYVCQSGPSLPEPKSPQPFALSSNISVFLPSSMHLTASKLALPPQQPQLVCHLGLSKHWDAGQATASPSISELQLLSFRRFLGCWPRHTLQDRGSAPRYQDITPVVFHNHSVMLAVFGIFFWVHTCHFHLRVAGWVGPLPHLSFHSLPGGTCTSLFGSSVTLQGVLLPPSLLYSLLLGCVAATLLVRTL